MSRRNTPLNKMSSGIACFLVAGILIILAVLQFQETKLNAKLYTEPISGTVLQCEAYKVKEHRRRYGTGVKTYYEITIGYEIEKGHPLTIERRGQTLPHSVGEEIPLMYDPETGEAVRKTETVQDPKVYLVLGTAALVLTAIGVFCIISARRAW